MENHNTSINLFSEHGVESARLINPEGKAPIVLICEHASNFIPPFLNDLGLNKEGLVSHAAWDIGAYEMACEISELLDAPLIAAKVSRLVYDCNRAPESGSGIPSKSEVIDVPGNKNLSEIEINERVKHVYEPFHELINQTIYNPDRLSLSTQHTSPAIITIHSFTPVYFGEERSVELGILHDKDDRLAKLVMGEVKNRTQLKAEFNAPYDVSDNVMHTINKHAQEKNFMNVMIEIKNDLLSNSSDINAMAVDLSTSIYEALANAKTSSANF